MGGGGVYGAQIPRIKNETQFRNQFVCIKVYVFVFEGGSRASELVNVLDQDPRAPEQW